MIFYRMFSFGTAVDLMMNHTRKNSHSRRQNDKGESGGKSHGSLAQLRAFREYVPKDHQIKVETAARSSSEVPSHIISQKFWQKC